MSIEKELIEYLLSKVSEEINVLKEDLARGTLKDFAEYKHIAGTIKGLSKSYYIIKETLERMKHDD